MAALGALTGDLDNSSTLDHDALRDLVATNSEPLRLVRLGLSRRCMVSVEAKTTDFPRLKSLALLLAAEGQLAELENRPADAASSYVDAIHLGNEITRGGSIRNLLAGRTSAEIGAVPLAKLVPGLTCEQARPLIARLEQIDDHRVTWDEAWQNENALMRQEPHKSANPINSFDPIDWVTGFWQHPLEIKKLEDYHNIWVARARLLMTEVSLRCYQAEQGRGPIRLEQLVPKYLHSVPLDPFGGQSLVYRSQGTNWLLYSIGEDRVDDGGKPAGPAPGSKGDLFFDSP